MEDWYTITGAIDSNTAQSLITYVNGLIYRTNIKRIIILISSSGGDIDSAIRIYSYLKALFIDVETIALSQIDSAANIIYVAGTKRIAISGCRFFLHEGVFTTASQTTTLHNHEEALVIFGALLKRSIEILSLESKQKEEKVSELLTKTTVFNTKEAMEFGLVHETLEKLPLTKQTV